MNYLSTKKTAERWKISSRRVNKYCNEGRIEGAKKLDWMWMIPDRANKPEDKRLKRNRQGLFNEIQYFEKQMFFYEKQVDKDKRSKNGVFYTDSKLVSLMYDNINNHINLDSTILDPCCGVGSFLIGALDKGYKYVYGLDIDRQAINKSKELLSNKSININTYNTLSNCGNNILNFLNISNIDIIIGNPPYVPICKDTSKSFDEEFNQIVRKNGNNLFTVALIRALDMVKKSGIISYIIPKNFLHIDSYYYLRKTILEKYKILSIVDIGSYFQNVRGEQIVLSIKKEKSDIMHNIELKKLIDKKFVNINSIKQSYFDNKIILFDSKEEINIYEKLKTNYKNLGQICTGYIGRGKSKSKEDISGKNIIKFGLKNTDKKIQTTGNKIFLQNIYSAESGIIGTFAGNLEARETVTVITDGNEDICRYLLGILHSRLCNYYLLKYCFNNSKLTMHTDTKYIKQIPIIMDVYSKQYNLVIQLVYNLEKEEYLSDNWINAYNELNKLVYEIYKFDSNEIYIIENNMKEIQSKRWFVQNEK